MINNKHPIPEGYPVFTGAPADDAMIESARAFVKEKGLSALDVKLAKRGGCTCVITKKELIYV